MPASAFVLALLLFPQAREGDPDGWNTASSPCADSLLVGEIGESPWDEAGMVPWQSFASGFVADEDCDPEEALLFHGVPPQEKRPESRHASLSVSRAPGKPAQSILRHRAEQNGWDHRHEFRDDTLARRSLGWRGGGWRLLAGDLADPSLPLWPQGLPRRTLPAGWKAAHRNSDGPGTFARSLSSPIPQGFGAGVTQPRWSAHALRTWNPVETGAEPPWRAAWALRHFATGLSLTPFSRPWTAALHFSETRIARGGADTLSQRLTAAAIVSPEGDAALRIAQSESDRGTGRFYGAELRHRFANAASVDLTARRRDGAWASAWDPAVSAAEAHVADSGSADEAWGAGEWRLAGRLPFDAGREAGYLRGETWRAWNPGARTARQGVRGAFGWRGEDARFELAGAHRATRAASGSVSLHRRLEAETRMESFPRWRIAVWRTWNRAGPLRTGGFLGAEPGWTTLHLNSGVRLEMHGKDEEEKLEGIAVLGLHWRIGSRWRLNASGSAPCPPVRGGEDARWRITVDYGG